MFKLYSLLLFFSVLLSCTSSLTNDSNSENANVEVVTENDSISDKEESSAKSLDYAFFERIENTWEYPTDNPELTEHGFVFKSLDTVVLEDSKIVKTVFEKPDADESIEVSDVKYNNGEILFLIKLFSTDKMRVNSILEALNASESLYIKKDEHFKKFGLGTYEDKVFRQNEIIKQGRRYYQVRYKHRIGKELMTSPVLDEENNEIITPL